MCQCWSFPVIVIRRHRHSVRYRLLKSLQLGLCPLLLRLFRRRVPAPPPLASERTSPNRPVHLNISLFEQPPIKRMPRKVLSMPELDDVVAVVPVVVASTDKLTDPGPPPPLRPLPVVMVVTALPAKSIAACGCGQSASASTVKVVLGCCFQSFLRQPAVEASSVGQHFPSQRHRTRRCSEE